MKHESLIKELKKNGFNADYLQISGRAKHFLCRNENRCVSWTFDDIEVTPKLTNGKDKDDCSRDYSAGYFAKTIKQVISFLKGDKE